MLYYWFQAVAQQCSKGSFVCSFHVVLLAHYHHLCGLLTTIVGTKYIL